MVFLESWIGMSMSRYLLPTALLTAALSLAGCGKQPAQSAHVDKTMSASAPVAADTGDAGPIPLAQLPRVAVPTHYRIALTIDPTKTSFSGHDEIDINVTKPLHTLYIHGNEINAKTVVVKTGNKTIAANYRSINPAWCC
jgi:hypothetical protein